ncbi:MAG: putative lipid II flippase FtsW [Actinomycetota bacterium]
MGKKKAARGRRSVVKSNNYYILLGTVIGLSLFGLVMVLSASHATALADYKDSFYFLKYQAVWLTFGLIAMFFFSKLEFRSFKSFAGWGVAASTALLVLVLIPGIGIATGGASRWLDIGLISFQPSELVKFALILFAADFLARRREQLKEFDTMLPLLVWLVAIAGLIMLQPDLGTTLIIAGIFFVLLLVAGARYLHLAALGAAGTAATIGLIWMAPYRKARLLVFLDPWKDPMNTGFQNVQSLIALGSGHLFGVGLGMSKQKFFYLPAAHTDFIFAIIGEELGLLGTMSVVIAFGLLAFAGIRIAAKATTYFDRYIATGITAMIIIQAVLNMGAVTGVLPITGVPLPLISSGGTSLLFTLTGVGILLNIASRERKANEGIIDASDYFRGRNRRTPVSRDRHGRRAGVS